VCVCVSLFLYKHFTLQRRTIAQTHQLNQVHKVFQTKLKASETRCLDIRRILRDVADISNADILCNNLIRHIETRQNKKPCSWIQLLTASMLLLCGARKIHTVVRAVMTSLDFDEAEDAMDYLYFVAHKLRFLREDIHGEPGIYFVKIFIFDISDI